MLSVYFSSEEMSDFMNPILCLTEINSVTKGLSALRIRIKFVSYCIYLYTITILSSQLVELWYISFVFKVFIVLLSCVWRTVSWIINCSITRKEWDMNKFYLHEKYLFANRKWDLLCAFLQNGNSSISRSDLQNYQLCILNFIICQTEYLPFSHPFIKQLLENSLFLKHLIGHLDQG